MSVDASLNAPIVRSHRWIGWILFIGVILVVAAGYATAKLYEYSDLTNVDTSPPYRKGLNAPFITTANPVIDKMIEVAQISADDLVYDLGCGDGRIVIAAAVQRRCHGVGFDIDPVRVAEAKDNAKRHGVDQLVTIEQHDVFKVDLSKADVIVAYLLPWMLRDLKPRFEHCEPGTRIVSHDFEIEGIEAQATYPVKITEHERHLVYLYITPLKKLPEKPKRKLKAG
jgi:SAM-dependent methyltransferase